MFKKMPIKNPSLKNTIYQIFFHLKRVFHEKKGLVQFVTQTIAQILFRDNYHTLACDTNALYTLPYMSHRIETKHTQGYTQYTLVILRVLKELCLYATL